MKKLTRTLIAFSLLVLTLCLLTACADKRPADYLDRSDVVIDNETPFVYAPETDIRIKLSKDDPAAVIDILTYVTQITSHPEELNTDYQTLIKYFGNKPVRELIKEAETLYYTVYSLTDNCLLYLYLEKNGDQYLCSDYFTADGREDDVTKDFVLPQDLPTSILGDALPKHCYLDYYSEEEIVRRSTLKWDYYSQMVAYSCLGELTATDPEGRPSVSQLRCIHDVTFDTVVVGEYGYNGMYVYDLYVYEDGTGSLYFYHFSDKDLKINKAYTLLQEEVIPLNTMTVTAIADMLTEWDFVNQLAWNPEEFSGMDGATTNLQSSGAWGDGFISMWEPTARYPHYHIRTAIEEIVRAHMTVEQGRVYRPDLYEEYEWMQD